MHLLPPPMLFLLTSLLARASRSPGRHSLKWDWNPVTLGFSPGKYWAHLLEDPQVSFWAFWKKGSVADRPTSTVIGWATPMTTRSTGTMKTQSHRRNLTIMSSSCTPGPFHMSAPSFVREASFAPLQALVEGMNSTLAQPNVDCAMMSDVELERDTCAFNCRC